MSGAAEAWIARGLARDPHGKTRSAEGRLHTEESHSPGARHDAAFPI